MTNNNIHADKHIDVLDGVRAVAMLFVVWFHFWQQTWLTPYINLPAGITNITRYMGLRVLIYIVFCGMGLSLWTC